MTLYDLVQVYEFVDIEPYLFKHYSDIFEDEEINYRESYIEFFLRNHYKAKELLDELKRMPPGYDSGEPIDLSTYCDFYDYKDEPWDETIARKLIVNPKFSYEEVLAAFIHDCKEWPDYGGDYLTTPNKYELKAIATHNKELFNYLKDYLTKAPEGHYWIDSNGSYWILSDEVWREYRLRTAHINRSKRMRDNRLYRSRVLYHALSNRKKLIDEITTVVPYLSDNTFKYLYHPRCSCVHFFFRSRTINLHERCDYMIDLLTNYYTFDMTGFTRAEVIICTSLIYTLSPSEEVLLRDTLKLILPASIRCRVLLGIKDELMDLDRDIQILLILSK